MINPFSTVLSQYGNSPTLDQLIDNWNVYIDPTANLDAFYNIVINVLTAQGFGLDIWGQIVGISRTIKIPAVPVAETYFGFQEAEDYEPFGQAPFWSAEDAINSIDLDDSDYRTLILVKARSNISNCTSRSYNQLLQTVFKGRGVAYVEDLGNMQMAFVFNFALLPVEQSILNNSGAFVNPAGVQILIRQGDFTLNFGFQEGMDYQPFDQGVFLPR